MANALGLCYNRENADCQFRANPGWIFPAHSCEVTYVLGIDYIIARSCPVKETLGDYFLVLVKKRARLNYLEQLQIEHPGFGEHTVFEEVEETPLGISRRQTSMSIMQEEIIPLQEWYQVCAECGANFTYHSGGCWGHIPYPIPRLVEKLLITTVQTLVEEAWDHKAAALLRSLPEVKKVTETANGWRQNGLTELTAPLTHTWGYLFRRQKISTDQLLEAVFGSNLLQEEDLSKVTVFLEYFQRSTRAGLQKAITESAKVAEQSQQMEDRLLPFWHFIKACQIADELQEGVLIIP